MKFTSVLTALFVALLPALIVADIDLNSFPSTVYVGGFYTLSWTATGNYSYTFWLVVESAGNTYANEFQWLKQQSLDSGLHFDTLTPSYTWTVPNNLNQQSNYALWIDGLAIPFNGESYTNITNWFQIDTDNATVSSTSLSSSSSSTSSSSQSATLMSTQSASTTLSRTSSGASSVSASGTATATAAAATAAASSEHHSSLSGGAIAGIVIGILVLIALLVGAAIFTIWRRRRTALQNREAAARANRLEPVMTGSSYEMQQRSPKATAEHHEHGV